MILTNNNVQLYFSFAEAFNDRNYRQLDQLMILDFVDHHPGLVDVTSLEVYKRNLAAIVDALEMKARPEEVVASEDKIFTRIELTGKHVGRFLGIPATGQDVTWYTNELWRVENSKLVERWAVDDIYGLVSQLGIPLPTWEEPE